MTGVTNLAAERERRAAKVKASADLSEQVVTALRDLTPAQYRRIRPTLRRLLGAESEAVVTRWRAELEREPNSASPGRVVDSAGELIQN